MPNMLVNGRCSISSILSNRIFYFRLISELNSLEGENWREKLSYSDEQFLTYLKLKTNFSEENAGQWFLTHADQFFLDACFVLAIKFYNYSLELQPERTEIYLKRAACYLKVYEVDGRDFCKHLETIVRSFLVPKGDTRL